LSKGVELCVIESTANYHMLFYDVVSLAMPVTVVNPTLVSAIFKFYGKSDAGDAAFLSQLAAMFEITPSNIPNKMQRNLRVRWKLHDHARLEAVRITGRLRQFLASEGVPIFNAIGMRTRRGIAALMAMSEGGDCDAVLATLRTRDPEKIERFKELLAGLPLTKPVQWYMQAWVPHLDQLMKQQDKAMELILQGVEEYELERHVQIVESIPALTRKFAVRYIAELGDARRYHSKEAFAKACGVAPGVGFSAGKMVVQGKAVHGNRRVLRHMMQCAKAWVIREHKRDGLWWWYQGKLKSRGYMKATHALANRLGNIVWVCITKDELYRPLPVRKYTLSREVGDETDRSSGS
jgi:transposase